MTVAAFRGIPSAAERAQQLYDVLCDMARNGQPCPSARDLGAMIGTGETAIRRAKTALAEEGRIILGRDYMNQRTVITITATGERTLDTPRTARTQPKPSQFAERDYRMAVMKAKGGTYETIAREFGISPMRVFQILKRNDGKLAQPVVVPAMEEPRPWCDQCERLVRAACKWAIGGFDAAHAGAHQPWA